MADKQKIYVGKPYQDQKSNEFEVLPAQPPCPRCLITLSFIEMPDGGWSRWCINCQTYYPLPKV